jgi:death on curing protein
MTPIISRQEALLLHQAALDAHGGLSGLRDSGLLDSALAQPSMTFDGRDLYPTTREKAAALATSLILNHPFVDGNKRVGFAAMAVFLLRNGFLLNCTDDEGESMMLAVAAHTAEREELTDWIARHTISAAT